jgi:choline-glycine betaine transporter
MARKDKKIPDEVLKERANEPQTQGRPVVYLAGLAALFIGLFIAIGSLVHNNLKVFVNETSHAVYGPYDWTAAIIGAVALLVGIVLLMFSRGTSRSS